MEFAFFGALTSVGALFYFTKHIYRKEKNMNLKFPYEAPKIALIKFISSDIITVSGGNSNLDTPITPETDWEDDNVMGDGWL